MRNLLLITLGTFTIVLFTKIKIDLNLGIIDIPITGQSLAVTLIGYLLYHKLGSCAVLLYLLMGIVGFPIFADGHCGLSTLAGNSGGYLYGFLPGAYMCGYLHSRGWNSFIAIGLTMLLGTVIILTIGVIHLTYYIGFGKALQYGLYPFIPGALMKIMLASIIAYVITRIPAWNRVLPSPSTKCFY